MLILTSADLRRAISMAEAIAVTTDAFAQLSSGQARMPLRPRVEMTEHDGVLLLMPAYLAGSGALGLKALTLYPQNPARHGLPAIAAVVLLFASETGRPLALLDAGELTALRTGAASGVATQLLARDDARTLAIFGAGAQALPQVWAVCVTRNIEHVVVINRTHEHAERLAAALRAFGPPVPGDVRVAASVADALRDADVICCATASPTPLFADADLKPGTHINAVGAYLPAMREVPGATVARARVVVDARDAAGAEAGELVMAREEGLIGAEYPVAELGEVALGRMAGRLDPAQITLFKSVGVAAQDIAVAQVAYARARELGLGTEAAF
ncbi:MAG: Ornithine cyclodeaminase [Ktedonobacterales bacterium]|jgi:ornithine cyclodeaminase|nr:MAG: Ornithine cyclodeaminase [Ktedonobacterales bacterium]